MFSYWRNKDTGHTHVSLAGTEWPLDDYDQVTPEVHYHNTPTSPMPFYVLLNGVVKKIDLDEHMAYEHDAMLSQENWDKYHRIAWTKISKKVFVSTVFLSIDHGFSFWKNAPPVLFETAIWMGKGGVQYQNRYISIDDALIGHEEAVKIAKRMCWK